MGLIDISSRTSIITLYSLWPIKIKKMFLSRELRNIFLILIVQRLYIQSGTCLICNSLHMHRCAYASTKIKTLSFDNSCTDSHSIKFLQCHFQLTSRRDSNRILSQPGFWESNQKPNLTSLSYLAVLSTLPTCPIVFLDTKLFRGR